MKSFVEAAKRKLPTRAVILASFLLAISCNQGEPKGQVVAVVNEDEITIAELNEEARARGFIGANQPAVQQALLQDLIDRKLLAQQAIRAKVDRSQQHLIASQRMKDIMLAQQLLASVGDVGSHTQAEIQKLITDKANALNRRTILLVDQVTFSHPSDTALVQRLEAAENLTAIEMLLQERAVPRERLVKAWDSAAIPEATINRLLEAKPRKPFLIPYGDLLIAGIVLSSVAQPMELEQRLRLASERLASEQKDRSMRQMLELLRADAQIRHADGFAPTSTQTPPD
jgi:EpsD family peptidyl-prolyl cis-trans isomerase